MINICRNRIPASRYGALCAFLCTFLCTFSVTVVGGALATQAHAETTVRIGTNLGDLFITLLPDAAPETVANFRTYIQAGDYNDSFFNFSQPAADGVEGVLQTGRFVWPEGGFIVAANERPPIADEFSLSNERGTVAVLRENNEPNTATNGWFINTADNGGSAPSGFDFVNGGVTVFGKLNSRSLALADEIAALRIEDRGEGFENLPVIGEPTATIERSQSVLILDTAEFESISDPVSAILPGSRTVPLGLTAMAFATVLNTDPDNDAASCRLTPPDDLQGTFSYQLTDPETNTPVGSISPLVDIPAGGSGTFIFSITPTENFESTEFAIDFNCGNAQESAATITGVNTFTLAVPEGLSSDVVAVSRTAGNTGINDIPVSVGSGAFVVATTNLGDGATITVTADGGEATLPLEFFVCETNPQDGLCLSPPSASVERIMGVNSTATFAVFTQLNDEDATVDFSPGENRAFVRFRNADGALRGSTSVALRTVAD